MSTIYITFDKLYANIVLNLFDSRKSLLNKCLNYIIVNKLSIDKIPLELVDLIRVYRCVLRIQDTILKRRGATSGKDHSKYKWHINFLALQLKDSIDSQFTESMESLMISIHKLALMYGSIVNRVEVDELVVSNIKNPEEFTKQINLFFNQSIEYKGFYASLYRDIIYITYRFWVEKKIIGNGCSFLPINQQHNSQVNPQ